MNSDLFNIGYAELYIAAGTTPSFPIETPAEMTAAYDNAIDREGIAALVRGELYPLHCAVPTDYLNSTTLVLNSTRTRMVPTGNDLAFRLDSEGHATWAVPACNSSGEIVDLIVGNTFDAKGRMRDNGAPFYMTTGRGALVGFDKLAGPWSADNPCAVCYQFDDFLETQAGVLVLRRSAKELLRLAAHVILPSWDLASDLADSHFEDDRQRCQGPQNITLYEAFLERRARDDLRAEPSSIAESWARFNAKLAREDAAREEGVIRRRPSKWTAAAKVQRKTQLVGGAL